MNPEPGGKSGRHPDRGALEIVLAGDHELLSISDTLAAAQARLLVAGKVRTIEAAITRCRRRAPDLMIIGFQRPALRAVEMLARLKRLCPGTRVLLCAGSLSEIEILVALRSGAEGLVERASDEVELLAAVNRMARGENYLCARGTRLLLEIVRSLPLEPAECTDAKLSEREKQVLGLITAGHTSKEIAEKLQRSLATVDTHRRNLMRKVGARNAAEAIGYGHKHHLPRAGEASRSTPEAEKPPTGFT